MKSIQIGERLIERGENGLITYVGREDMVHDTDPGQW